MQYTIQKTITLSTRLLLFLPVPWLTGMTAPLANAAPVGGDAQVVNTLADDTDSSNSLLSLREAIEAANAEPGSALIRFGAGLNGTIVLTNGELLITDDLTIQGPNANRLSISGNLTSRIFHVAISTNVHLSGLTLKNGASDGTAADYPGFGGAILNLGDLSLKRVNLSHNQATGDAGVDIQVNDWAIYAGSGGGGAIANFGRLQANLCNFFDNLAQGADDTIRTIPGFPAAPFGIGLAVGGAIYNDNGLGIDERAVANLNLCSFENNMAQAGDDCVGDFAGVTLGGAIWNTTELTINLCSFDHNCSFGGDQCVGPNDNGVGNGGAISSGTLRPLLFPDAIGADLTIHHSSFTHNFAMGGNDNIPLLPPSKITRSVGPGNAHGGAIIAWHGSARIDHTVVAHNVAQAGTGSASFNGSGAIGGGIILLGFVGELQADLRHMRLTGNRAIGGAGSGDLDAGSATGGGLAAGSFDSPFGLRTVLDMNHCQIRNNSAEGGNAGSGNGGTAFGGGFANGSVSATTSAFNLINDNCAIGGEGSGSGGDGLGGGVYNESGTSIDLAKSGISKNLASGGSGSANGTGFGGGIYNDGDVLIDAVTLRRTRMNSADIGSDVFGL